MTMTAARVDPIHLAFAHERLRTGDVMTEHDRHLIAVTLVPIAFWKKLAELLLSGGRARENRIVLLCERHTRNERRVHDAHDAGDLPVVGEVLHPLDGIRV